MEIFLTNSATFSGIDLALTDLLFQKEMHAHPHVHLDLGSKCTARVCVDSFFILWMKAVSMREKILRQNTTSIYHINSYHNHMVIFTMEYHDSTK